MHGVLSRLLMSAVGVFAIAVWTAPAIGSESPETKDASSQVLIDEDFEHVFPRVPWRVSHPDSAADVDWGRSNYRASSESYSIYCAGMGPAAPDTGGPAPAGTASWAIVGPFDLSEASSGSLSFDLWLKTEQYRDVFMWLVSIDGETFSGSARSTDTGGWQSVMTDLSNWGAAGSVLGEPEVWVAFVYQSDHNNLLEGAYLDDVYMEVDLGSVGDEGRTYTSDADFAEGVMVGVESNSDRLVLSDEWDALPFLWVPNSVTGTVSKVDAVSGDELARYRTGPTTEVDPGVAAVDQEGSCWVGNREAGTVVKIGLYENGGCLDRDGDAEILTSTDSNDDGDITGSEILAWGDDECVLVEVVLVEGLEGTHVPGDDHSDYEANALQAVAVDADGDIWAGVYSSNLLYHLDGETGEILDQVDLSDEATYPTSAVVDGDGTLWVTSWPDQWILGLDPSSGETTRVELEHGSSGVALNKSGDLFITGYEQRALSKIDVETGEVEWLQTAGWLADGVATTEEGRIWVAAAGDATLSRYSTAGVANRWLELAGGPTGVAVDQDGKVWVASAVAETIYRIDPDAVYADVVKNLVASGGHDATGDFTGIVARNLTSRFGTWTVVHDSQIAGTPWGVISWEETSFLGTVIRVRVRSSEDEETWSAWEWTANGVDLSASPNGRYLEIQASMQLVTGEDLPKLQELTVVPKTTVTAPTASFQWSPASPTAGQSVAFSDTSSGVPSSWTWDFGDGSTSEDQNPSHVFTDDGDFNISLTVANDAGSDTVTQQVTIGPATGCTVTCSAAVPATADLDEVVTFSSTVETLDCTGTVEIVWDFGDGATSDQQNPDHAYATTGTLRWSLSATADGKSCTASGDITVSGAGPDGCSATYWVPVVSHTDGTSGSVWRSDLGLLGADTNGADVELRFHGSDPVATRVITVAPGAMVQLVDIVDWIASGFSGSGALEICADGALVVDSRTYNLLASDHECFPEGTFGQHLAGGLDTAGLAEGETARLGQLRESPSFRTNIGLVNMGADSATIRIELFDATGAQLTEYEVELGAGQWSQENRPFKKKAGREDLEAASARVTLVSGDGVVAYASVIDNLTNDATTIPMR